MENSRIFIPVKWMLISRKKKKKNNQTQKTLPIVFELLEKKQWN